MSIRLSASVLHKQRHNSWAVGIVHAEFNADSVQDVVKWREYSSAELLTLMCILLCLHINVGHCTITLML